MKSILTYGATLAVTIATFAVLAQSGVRGTKGDSQKKEYAIADIHTNGSVNFTLQQAINEVFAQRGGQITKAERETEDGKSVYEIKGIDGEGKRYKVYLNVANGQTVSNDSDRD